MELFAQAVAVEPDNRDALLYYAAAAKEAVKHDVAHEAYQRLLKAHPDYAVGFSLYGCFLKNIGEYAQAVPFLQRSLELHDDHPTRNVLVICLFKLNRIEEARQEGQRSLIRKDEMVCKNYSKRTAPASLIQKAIPNFTPKRSRNVISFSLWGDNPVYTKGAVINARIAPHIYYGWSTRFYCDATVPNETIAELKEAGASVVMITDPVMQKFKPLWRFFVANDPNIDRFLCRDADSRLNCQELLAVEEWVRSGRPFHVMRDHIYHMELMLAGMWGGVANILPDIKPILLASAEYEHSRFADQAYLMNEVWPIIREYTLTHDSYYSLCETKEFPSAYQLPRPVHVGGGVKSI